MKQRPGQDDRRRRHRNLEQRLLPELGALRAALLEESERVRRDRGRRHGREPEHLCCRRPKNQMRISPLEARAIAEAFREDPRLRSKLPDVLRRLAVEVPLLRENDERQSFDCPLLEGDRCLVHRAAKPIGCLAWNPGREYSKKGWSAFEARDDLNDAIYGSSWHLRAIPLWLKRVFRQQLHRYLSTPRSDPSPEGESQARSARRDRRGKPGGKPPGRRGTNAPASNSTRRAL